MTELNHDAFRKLISGKRTGLPAAFVRSLLAAAATVYSSVISLRNSLYSKGWSKTHTVDVPVISVGNITVGGTGKTPLVIWLYGLLHKKSIRCAILTRGYKTLRDRLSDEPAIIAKSCHQAKVIINTDRLTAASRAIHKFDAQLLIMDDGFQHRRLARDLDIVTIDATQPFGYGKLLPAGLLREPPTALNRADAVVITRADQLVEYKLSQLENKLRSLNPDMIIARAIHDPITAKSIGNKEISTEQLKAKKIFAFCGIANPNAFLSTIKRCRLNLVGSKIYNDHYHYAGEDIATIYEQARHHKADLVLSTQKDWTKTALLAPVADDLTFAYLAVELKFLAGEDKFIRLIENTIQGKIPSSAQQ
ncbi:MAG: tetraacyldisaccharide 4'-kinase [Planctomycetota bacterium]|jgi:tetraacyldisaccharide 4'-kinase